MSNDQLPQESQEAESVDLQLATLEQILEELSSRYTSVALVVDGDAEGVSKEGGGSPQGLTECLFHGCPFTLVGMLMWACKIAQSPSKHRGD